jgi:hypothetical protein
MPFLGKHFKVVAHCCPEDVFALLLAVCHHRDQKYRLYMTLNQTYNIDLDISDVCLL